MTSQEYSYQRTTIVFPVDGSEIILGMKKQGFGEGWWNGFGGKLEPGETYEEGARREIQEEAGLTVKALRHVANLHFYFDEKLGVVSRAYIAKEFDGVAAETDEMIPRRFNLDDMPYENMWPADKLWIPGALSSPVSPLGFVVHFDGEKRFKSLDQINADLLENKF